MQISPVITPGNTENVHHILVYECSDLDATYVGYSALCDAEGVAAMMVSQCRQGTLISGWAVGGGVSLSTMNTQTMNIIIMVAIIIADF